MSSRKRRKYGADFKHNAVNLSNDPTRSVSEVARSASK
ncbi:MAG: transposase [Planctomycetes bacterium]|nr:transposase [Planctomycetota bacterium]